MTKYTLMKDYHPRRIQKLLYLKRKCSKMITRWPISWKIKSNDLKCVKTYFRKCCREKPCLFRRIFTRWLQLISAGLLHRLDDLLHLKLYNKPCKITCEFFHNWDISRSSITVSVIFLIILFIRYFHLIM